MKFNELFSIQIELCEGCTRKCKQCGIWSLPSSDKNFMTADLANSISTELGTWLTKGRRIEFALQGEPLLNPNAVEIIKIFRKNYPSCQLQITTNGDPIKSNPAIVSQLFDAGLNLLVLDAYDKNYPKLPNMVSDKQMPPWKFYSNKIQQIILIDNFTKFGWSGSRRTLNNQAGFIKPEFARELGIPILKEPLKKRCSNVFHELVIKYDGTVPACCMMWKPELVIGKFPEQSLESIWNSDKFNLVRQLLYNKQRILEPCSRCDYSGFKTGLLKNPNFPLPEKFQSHDPEQTQFHF